MSSSIFTILLYTVSFCRLTNPTNDVLVLLIRMKKKINHSLIQDTEAVNTRHF